MKRLKSLALAAVLLATGTAGATDIAIDTAAGRKTVATPVATVAVFDIAAIDTLDKLGIRPAGLPSNLYLKELSRLSDGATVVGDIFEPDLEALSALAPDLIILGGRSSTKVDATAKVAPTIDMTMDGDDLIDQARARIATYGRLFGKETEAEAARKELDGAIETARAAVAGKGKALIVMTNGPKVTAYGPGSRFGWLHRSLDLPPAITEVEAATHGEAISFEFIREANPDWLIVLDRAAAIGSNEQNARITLDNELVAETVAWKKGQVVYLPSGDFYIAAGGAQAMIRVYSTIAEAFAAAK
ncbi:MULTISPECIES: siderophore ABC transporter substrate-binding protein [unclassified Shinella]|uniref:siderophore ABC transporter substrate-binding protein n=1 Tax=unclassified Shinella TaxID=2643062 RepID=UPI00234EF40C|nr:MULTISPECIES: siderophore ABC transporter substrate-binding protein [unclassified Shinella]MCO5153583.1 siderophore ABC transporter substrate-binding protein [Shinella sp.]MDC7265744.1 siderophore ABC transporter substrate-binding protein [Shinella sp. HY16]MDC7272641.1 siderophore ABC transporter substrate-binding protein [Shinella sp. YZ44]